MEIFIYVLVGFILGSIIGWQIVKAKLYGNFQAEKLSLQHIYTQLEKEFIEYKATSSEQLRTTNINLNNKTIENDAINETVNKKSDQIISLNTELATLTVTLEANAMTLNEKITEYELIKQEIKALSNQLSDAHQNLATANATNNSLSSNMELQKKETEELRNKFNLEFENIANKILETKSEKFIELNKQSLKNILEPLGQNIADFKKQVDEVYQKESKERFSLGVKVKELTDLNQQISTDAKNLTQALKGEAKTQGKWGEMILESILEKSGLRKNEQYFMEHELLDDNGNQLLSEAEDKKMRPDVVIKYPDNRHVIIDSKVSLNAFTRLIATNDIEIQNKELKLHIGAIKTHINSLSAKGYDDYNKSLDFVLMFIPSEPAYITALQEDPDLWNYAYDKRILLISPTNLITSLKLILDLWKREYQTENAIEIASRGAKLYDKFVGFVSNLDDVGDYIEKAQKLEGGIMKILDEKNLETPVSIIVEDIFHINKCLREERY
ncbi:MAG: DNA recombination protein RmuC, partial [Burkholderiales bacterium]|nr:DNA recombination protein RmuC [Burkholderiales bacterium]